MSGPVDELFGAGPVRPPEPDRLGGLGRMLVGSIVLNLALPLLLAWEVARVTWSGVPDWAAAGLLLTVPSAMVTLWVWQRADEERVRASSAGDEEGRIRAGRLRRLAGLGLLFCMVAMSGQTWVLGMMIRNATGEG